MTKQSKKTPHKNLLFAAIIILICASVAVWLLTRPADPKNTASSSSNSTKSSTTGGGTAKDTTSTSQTSTQSNLTTEQVPASAAGSVTISTLKQSGSYVIAAAQVSNFATTQCVYTFTKDGSKPVVREVSNSCSEVSIPVGEFEMIGTYTLTVNVYNGTQKLSASQDISVQ